MEFMDDWEATKRRFHAFWNQEIADRCMMAVTAPRSRLGIVNDATRCDTGDGNARTDRAALWTDGECILERRLRDFRATYFAGDAFPQIWLNLGAAGHAAFFKGARYGFGESTVWFSPSLPADEEPELEFDPDAELYRATLELARYLAAESHGRYFVSMPDISGNIDALAHLRGSENILIDMLERPDWVRRQLARVQEAWELTVENVYQLTRGTNDGGSTIGWLNTWAPGRHAQMQCDISVMISPESFVEFAVPEFERQTAWMDRSLYHFDGVDQERHLDALLALPALHAVQFTCVAGQASPVSFLPLLKRIQAAGKSLVIPFYEGHTEQEVVTLLEELSSRGLMMIARADSPEEADHLVSLASRYTHA